jgi:hypothetical protein
VNVAASVPSTAPYLNKAVLDVQNVLVNGAVGAAVSGVEEAAFLGNVTGSGQYSALDGSLISQDAVGSGSGFAKFKDLDPTVIGDPSGSGGLTALDASLVRQVAVGSSVPQIPSTGGVTPPSGGLDPRLYFLSATAGAGGTTVVHLHLNVSDPSGIQLSAIGEAITFDPTVFTVSNVVTGGGLDPAHWSTTSNVDNTVGFIRVAQSTDAPNNLASGTDLDVLDFTITVNANAAQGSQYTLKLDNSVTSNNSTTFTQVFNNSGPLTLSPAPQNDGGFTNGVAANFVQNVDNNLTVVGPGGTLFAGTSLGTSLSASAGGTVTVPVKLTNGLAPIQLAAIGEALSFDPSVLTLTNVSQGPGLPSASWSTTTNSGVIGATITSISESGSIVTVVTNGAHGFSTGQSVVISGVTPSGYNGTFTATVVNGTTFTYTDSTTGLASSSGGVASLPGALDFIRVAQSTSATLSLASSQTIEVLDLTFAVNPNATGSTVVNLRNSVSSNNSTTFTQIFLNSGPIPLGQVTGIASASESGNTVTITTPGPNTITAGQQVLISGVSVAGYNGAFTVGSVNTANNTFTYTDPTSGLGAGSFGTATNNFPTDAATDVVDGALNIVINPNQPPFDSLPAASAIPTVLFNPAAASGLQTATPNTAVLSSANNDAITVSDGNQGAEQLTTTLTVTGAGGNPSGTLTLAGTTNLTVTGNGTNSVTLQGLQGDINNALNGLIYTPAAGYFGTTTLTVSTTNDGTGHFGGPLTDTRSTTITVVGLYISEVDTLKGTVTNPSQYVEVFSTVPSYIIPSGVYLVGINGAAGTPAPGLVTDIFNLSGFTTGSNGYLALLEKSEKYASGGFEVANGNELDNSGTGLGFGSGAATSKFGTISGVHTGGTRPTGQLATDILLPAAESFLLIQAATAPTTTTNIDPANTGNPTNQTTAYTNWNVLDSVAIMNSASTSHSYAAITFEPTGAAGTTLSGSTVVTTSTFTANYVGRIAQNTGHSSADWLASVVTGTASTGVFNLGTTSSTQFGGQPLNSVGGPNDWAPQMTVAVNDGSSNQHSQVAELSLTFSAPVNIVDLRSDFQVKDASGNLLSINVFDLNTGATTIGTTGAVPDTGATQVFVTFNADATHTFTFGTTTFTDLFGNAPTVGLLDGNYFLNTKVADISSASNSTVLLDGAHNGVSGSTTTGTGNLNGNGVNEVDEFWRLFGDINGTRTVDALDAHAFGLSDGASMSAGTAATISTATESGSTVTITTSAPSGFSVGEQITISGVSIAGYNGNFIVTSVSGNTFTYTVAATGLTNGTGGSASANTTNYFWYMDNNEDGNIDVGNTLDSTPFFNNRYGRNGGTHHLQA